MGEKVVKAPRGDEPGDDDEPEERSSLDPWDSMLQTLDAVQLLLALNGREDLALKIQVLTCVLRIVRAWAGK